MSNPVSNLPAIPLHELEATFADKKFELPPMGSFPATGHLFDRATVLAVVAACGAERPLLLRGEPGVGKSQLAQAAAFMLGRHLLTSVIQPRTEYQDLLWSFDYTERLGQAQLLSLQKKVADAAGALDAKKFISPGPVWWALNWEHAQKHANVSGYRPNPTPDNLPPANGVVLLIDEIDKADIDLPNGLLEVLGNGAFNVPWLDEAVKPAAGPGRHKPLIIITSNDGRELPQAFTRRCIVHEMRLPEEPRAHLIQIGQAQFAGKIGLAVLEKAADLLLADREEGSAERGRVGQAEYLDLLRTLANLTQPQYDPEVQDEYLEKLNCFILKKHGSA
jgi:MoxR-like ATPase